MKNRIQPYETLAAGVNPCPFCGSKIITVYTKEFYDEHKQHKVYVMCKECGGEMVSERISRNYEGAFESAVSKWNRRPGDGPAE